MASTEGNSKEFLKTVAIGGTTAAVAQLASPVIMSRTTLEPTTQDLILGGSQILLAGVVHTKVPSIAIGLAISGVVDLVRGIRDNWRVQQFMRDTLGPKPPPAVVPTPATHAAGALEAGNVQLPPGYRVTHRAGCAQASTYK